MDVSSRDNIAIFVTRSVKTGQVGTHYTSHHITGDYSVLGALFFTGPVT